MVNQDLIKVSVCDVFVYVFRLIGGMVFFVFLKMFYDIFLVFGKGLYGFKVEVMVNQWKLNDLIMGKEDGFVSLVKSRVVLEIVMFGIFIIMMVVVFLVLISVFFLELVLQVKEVIEEWCMFFICFVVFIVGIVFVIFGVLGGLGGRVIFEQNYKFIEFYFI